MSRRKIDRFTEAFGPFFAKWKGRENDSKVETLANVPLFKTMTRRQIKRISENVYERIFGVGEFVYEKGMPAASMYIIKKGSVEILLTDPDGGEEEIGKLKEGAFFGESALLDDSPRWFSARAGELSEIYSIFRADIERSIELDQDMAQKLYKNMSLLVGKTIRQYFYYKHKNPGKEPFGDIDGQP